MITGQGQGPIGGEGQGLELCSGRGTAGKGHLYNKNVYLYWNFAKGTTAMGVGVIGFSFVILGLEHPAGRITSLMNAT